jgi:hypothetical protein
LLCIDDAPVPDGTPCDDSVVRLMLPQSSWPYCQGACTRAEPPPPPGGSCSCDTDCPPRHKCMSGTCVCNDGWGEHCNDVCRAGSCVSDVNLCATVVDP